MRKVYVTVTALFKVDGTILPISIEWEDGRNYEIDKIIEVRQAASLKVGGQGTRYLCRIQGRESNLFLEGTRWFVEGKE